MSGHGHCSAVVAVITIVAAAPMAPANASDMIPPLNGPAADFSEGCGATAGFAADSMSCGATGLIAGRERE
jgi:hypothetical protein